MEDNITLTDEGHLAVPPRWSDAPKINLALSRLPQRLQAEYRAKLKDRDRGTLCELAVLGGILERAGEAKFVLFPEGKRIDAVLKRGNRLFEIEIKAILETLWESGTKEVCERVRDRIAAEFPGLDVQVRLCDWPGCFESDPRPNKAPALNIERSVEKVLELFRSAVNSNGSIKLDWQKYRPGRLILNIEPVPKLMVYVGSITRPGGSDVETFDRKITSALRDKLQFSGDYPGILVCVLAGDPDPTVVAREYNHVSEKLFEAHSFLALVVGMSYPTFRESLLVHREPKEEVMRGTLLSADEVIYFSRLFDFPLVWTTRQLESMAREAKELGKKLRNVDATPYEPTS